MKTSEQINEIAVALSAFQGEVQDVVKDTKAYGYYFADLAQLLKATRPLLAKHGLALIQLPFNGAEGHVGVTTRVAHASGQWIEESLELPVEAKKGLSQAQCAGSILTYLRRYAAGAVLCIASEADDDGASGRDSTERHQHQR